MDVFSGPFPTSTGHPNLLPVHLISLDSFPTVKSATSLVNCYSLAPFDGIKPPRICYYTRCDLALSTVATVMAPDDDYVGSSTWEKHSNEEYVP